LIFCFQDVKVEKRRPSWLSQILYHGGFTFYPEDPTNYLKITNLVAAKRIAEVVHEKYGLRGYLDSALCNLEFDGDILPTLDCYRDMMVQHGDDSDYSASEQTHGDSFFSLLRNAGLRRRAEFQVTMVS